MFVLYIVQCEFLWLCYSFYYHAVFTLTLFLIVIFYFVHFIINSFYHLARTFCLRIQLGVCVSRTHDESVTIIYIYRKIKEFFFTSTIGCSALGLVMQQSPLPCTGAISKIISVPYITIRILFNSISTLFSDSHHPFSSSRLHNHVQCSNNSEAAMKIHQIIIFWSIVNIP